MEKEPIKIDEWLDLYHEQKLPEGEELALFEMATMCSPDDGYGFYVCVYGSGDEPGYRDEHLPMHAHVLAKIKPKIEFGCVDLTNENPPKDPSEVIDANKKRLLPSSIKKEIVKWLNEKNEDYPEYTNWAVCRKTFRGLNKRLFPKTPKTSVSV